MNKTGILFDTDIQHSAGQRDLAEEPDLGYAIGAEQPYPPITVITNLVAGAKEKQEIQQRIGEVLAESGCAFSIVEVEPDADFVVMCEREVIKAGRVGGW